MPGVILAIDFPQIILNHPNALEKADFYKFLGAIAGDSLVCAKGSCEMDTINVHFKGCVVGKT